MAPRRRGGEPTLGDPAYRQLWRLIDGAVASALAAHPDYLTSKGRRSARTSITKRATGAVYGYVTEVTENGSGSSPAVATAEGSHMTLYHGGGTL